jgi:hypothetical protein
VICRDCGARTTRRRPSICDPCRRRADNAEDWRRIVDTAAWADGSPEAIHAASVYLAGEHSTLAEKIAACYTLDALARSATP